ncbi:MAG: hypothetical protein WD115_00825 [Balneolaceae bacterium]
MTLDFDGIRPSTIPSGLDALGPEDRSRGGPNRAPYGAIPSKPEADNVRKGSGFLK